MRYWSVFIVSLLLLGTVIVDCNQPNVHVKQSEGILRRNLQSGIPYKVNLLLALDFVNDTIALQFETSDIVPSTNASTHFCYAVNTQVCLTFDYYTSLSLQYSNLQIAICLKLSRQVAIKLLLVQRL